jgi:hypothetical protein
MSVLWTVPIDPVTVTALRYCVTMPHESVVVLPVLNPPWSKTPERGRVFTLRSKPLKFSIGPPRLSAKVMRVVDLADLVRVQIVQAGDRVTAAAGQHGQGRETVPDQDREGKRSQSFPDPCAMVQHADGTWQW